eukprot:INCI1040.1.p1 GENE.INCI1040.1~~INCI1040.1.p1  ORF type:complete len:829 (+),score=156.70 INCI1040.1:240-2726(+)
MTDIIQSLSGMRGLKLFISDIRNCKNQQEEATRVDRELGKIRKKFTSTKKLDGYNQRKYVWKMVYIHMLGYEVDFGAMEVINLITSTKFVEKSTGYLATSIILNQAPDLMQLILNALRNDLVSGTPEAKALALQCVSNMGNGELAHSVSEDVYNLLIGASEAANVRKKAALCLLRVLRATGKPCPAQWHPQIFHLFDCDHYGLITAAASLVLSLVSRNAKACLAVVPRIVLILEKLVVLKSATYEYVYYNTPAPWLQVKLFKILQFFPLPTEPTLKEKLMAVLHQILDNTTVTKSVNKNNTDYSILFEAVNYIIHLAGSVDRDLQVKAAELLGQYVGVRQPNIRYIALSSMARLAMLGNGLEASIKKHQKTILFSLKDADVSIRQRALDLLFLMTDQENCLDIVHELLLFLVIANEGIKEEMVLKIAILAERFAPDYKWYMDTILTLISTAGDHVSDEIWHRAIQIVTNNEDLQKYAAKKVFDALTPTVVHENMVKCGAYILGEYGYILNDDTEEPVLAQAQFDLLQRHFRDFSNKPQVQQIILHAFAKMMNLFPEVAEQCYAAIDPFRSSINNELQQRALEYAALRANPALLANVFDTMPAFSQERQSVLVTKLRAQQSDSADGNVWADADSKAASMADVAAIADGSAAAVMAASDGNVITVDAKLAAKLGPWRQSVIAKNSGVMLETKFVQVGVKQEFRADQGRIQFFVGNKSTTEELTDCSCLMGTCNGALRVSAKAFPSEIGSKKQAMHSIVFACNRPFAGSPLLTLCFTHGEQVYNYTFPSAVTTKSFVTPTNMPQHVFLQRFESMGADKTNVQTVRPDCGAV